MRFSRLVMYVRDNGIGCPDVSQSASLGITGMHERARSVGGTLTIRGRRNRGTLVAFHLPLGPPS
jgi:signal transduction histidine kinase